MTAPARSDRVADTGTPAGTIDVAAPATVAASTGAIATLIAAAATRDAGVAAIVGDLGPASVAQIAVDEILFRACLADIRPAADDPVRVTLAFTYAGRVFAAPVTVYADGVHAKPVLAGLPDLPLPAVTQDLCETIRSLYGPRELVSAATRTIRWPGPDVVFPTPERPGLPTAFYTVVQRVVQVLERAEPADLGELAVRYGADKFSAMHQFPRHYQRHFGPLRDHRLTILDIGIGGFDDPGRGGASLRMWKRFFPRALVHGVDILDKHLVAAPRITTIRADQSSTGELAAIAERFGPFDIVIDDGSHISSHVIGTFGVLFPHVAPTGLYVIEDLQTSYWPEVFSGNDSDLHDPGTSVGFLKTLVDGLHHEELLRSDVRAPLPSDTQIDGVHIYHNMAVIEKGPNVDGSLVAGIFRAGRAHP